MSPKPRLPLSLRICGSMLALAARLVPASQRADWKREWQAEIWHRWQFLEQGGAWNERESFLLLRRSLGLLPDALWCFADQNSLRARLRDAVRSPWICLAGLAIA